MKSNGITQLIIYKEIEKNKYIYMKTYDICVGTPCKELGLSTQYHFIDINNFSKNSIKTINIEYDQLSISYTFPKIIDNISELILNDFDINILSNLDYIDRPIIILVESDFNFDLINKYIETFHEYGVKEYK